MLFLFLLVAVLTGLLLTCGRLHNYIYGAFGEGGRIGVGYEGKWGGYFDQRSAGILNWNRWYLPLLGEWLRRDPIGLKGGLNYYSYVGNNPIVSIDPLSLCCTQTISDCKDNVGKHGDNTHRLLNAALRSCNEINASNLRNIWSLNHFTTGEKLGQNSGNDFDAAATTEATKCGNHFLDLWMQTEGKIIKDREKCERNPCAFKNNYSFGDYGADAGDGAWDFYDTTDVVPYYVPYHPKTYTVHGKRSE